MDGQAYAYLLIEREFRRPGAPFIFKPGRSEVFPQRCKQYPKDSRVLCVVPVAGNGKDAEDAILDAFGSTFVQRRDVGTEYFHVPGCATLAQAARLARMCFESVAQLHQHVPELTEIDILAPAAADAVPEDVHIDASGTHAAAANDTPTAPVATRAPAEPPNAHLDVLLRDLVADMAAVRPGDHATVAEVVEAVIARTGLRSVTAGRVLHGMRSMFKVKERNGQLGVMLPAPRLIPAAGNGARPSPPRKCRA